MMQNNIYVICILLIQKCMDTKMLSKKSSSRARNIYLKIFYGIVNNMNNYSCDICNLIYKTRNGLFKHNKKYHPNEDAQQPKNYLCKYCSKGYNTRQSRWMHEQKCKITTENKKSLEEQVKILNEKVQILEQKPNSVTNNTTNNNITNNTNIQYVINAPTSSSITHLTFDHQKQILNKGLNSLTYLIENVNFNKSAPENHSYCVTAINDKHASVIDEKTNTIVKTNKDDLYDNVLTSHLELLEQISKNPKFTKEEKQIYSEKINYLKTSMYQNNKFKKRYKSDINLISYNNKDMVKETWKNLKPINIIKTEEIISDNTDEVEYQEGDKPRGFDDLIDEIPDEDKPSWLKKSTGKHQLIPTDSDDSDSELSSDDSDESESDTEECNVSEITIKSKQYILDGSNVYCKNSNGTRGELYGTYLNGRVKKISKTKEFNL